MNRSASSLRGAPESHLLRLTLHRDETGGLGLSIAGGIESTPYKEGDQGLFVSRVAPGGPAERAGLKQGDKLLRVNDSDVVNVRHETAVQKMQDARATLELTVLRIDESPKTPTVRVSQHSCFPTAFHLVSCSCGFEFCVNLSSTSAIV